MTHYLSSSTMSHVCINPGVSEQNRGQELIKYESSQIAVAWDFSQVKVGHGTGTRQRVLPSGTGGLTSSSSSRGRPGTVIQALGFSLVSRAECALACENERLHGIKARLSGRGPFENVLIQCTGMDTGGLEKCAVLYVHIGKDLVLKVRKLHWNFRGMRRKVLADGLEVEIAWNVQAWLFGEGKSDAKGKKNPPEFATFAFITQHGSTIFHC